MPRLLLLAALLCLLATPVAAQRPQTREGFWISGGLGYGSLDVGCDGCESDRQSGATARLAMGGTPRRDLLLGAELTGWHKEVDGVDITLGHLAGVVSWYPSPATGFFVTGGAGIASLTTDAGPLGDDSDSGIGLQAGAGYDIRVGRSLSLTPTAGVYWSNLDVGNANLLQVGLSVTGH